MRYILLSVSLFLTTIYANAQDTIRLMHYNLLNYGNYTSYCTSSNNNINQKTYDLRTITNYVLPDILTVNEMRCNSNVADIILQDVLNENGIDYFERAQMSCTSPISNMIFFNTEKVSLYQQDFVSTNYREIDLYTFYHNTEDLDITHDTIFFTCIVAHLKAGNSSSNEDERALEIQRLLNHLNQNYQPGNFLILGDFNVYTSSEEAFKKLISPTSTFRFFDPIEMIGSWHNNSYFAAVHTQSTHEYSGCAAGGGMDDRFDFIMISERIKNASENIAYHPDSYQAIGQDGKHFNKAINDYPTNTSVPPDVLDALYRMSDHLPVAMQILIGRDVGVEEYPSFISDFRIINPVREEIEILIGSKININGYIRVYSITGQKVRSEKIKLLKGENTLKFDQQGYPEGFYIVRIDFEDGRTITGKMIR